MIEGVYLLLGSNLGDTKANLANATHQIEQTCGTLLRQSSLYRTAAWGKQSQPDFLNQVQHIKTSHSPKSLLAQVLAIEQAMGRVRQEKWGQRLIDIDILYFNDAIINETNLQVPHPGIAARRFVLEPLTEIAPDFIHPVLLKSNKALLANCTDPLVVQRLD